MSAEAPKYSQFCQKNSGIDEQYKESLYDVYLLHYLYFIKIIVYILGISKTLIAR